LNLESRMVGMRPSGEAEAHHPLAEKRLRRSQIFIDPDVKKVQLCRSDICLGRLAIFGCMALDAAPSGADRVYLTVTTKI
jgi:hypothetical protein